jgi:branched-subunit amino acid transport protein AzlD
MILRLPNTIILLIWCYLKSQMLQVAEYHANALVSAKPKKPSLKERKHKLLTFLKGTPFLLPCLHNFYMISIPHVLIAIMVIQTFFWQRGMNLSMLSGLRSVALFVDGLKTGTTIKLSFATGNIASSICRLLIFRQYSSHGH